MSDIGLNLECFQFLYPANWMRGFNGGYVSVGGFWLILAKLLVFYRVKGPKGDKISVFLYTLYLAGSFVFYLDSLCIVLGRRVSFFSWTEAQVAEKGREKATHGEREKQG